MKMVEVNLLIKIIHVGSNLPGWVKAITPGSMTQVEEKSWNAYPYVKTVYTCPFFGDRFSITSETRYFDGEEVKENVHNLSEQALKEAQVDIIDIVEDEVAPRYYKKEEDPKVFHSEKTGRGPLAKDWKKTQKPIMTIHKLQTVEFRVWGVQTKVEQWLQKSMVRDVLTLGHKQAFCWIDDWYGLTMEDIRKIEEETKVLLDKMRNGNENSSSTATESKEEEETKEEVVEESKEETTEPSAQ